MPSSRFQSNLATVPKVYEIHRRYGGMVGWLSPTEKFEDSDTTITNSVASLMGTDDLSG
jgi:hypothetical protein